MKNSDEDRFVALFTGMCEYWDKPYSQSLLEIYFSALRDIPIERVETAVTLSIRSLKYFPRVVEIMELVCEGSQEKALSAWEQLTEAVRREGAYGSITFLDPKITRVVEGLGGWCSICQWPEKEMQYRRAEFFRLYGSIKEGGRVRSLPGLVEAENRARGFLGHIPVSVAVGTDANKLLKGNNPPSDLMVRELPSMPQKRAKST